jgi:hypothetical protein
MWLLEASILATYPSLLILICQLIQMITFIELVEQAELDKKALLSL